jgi:hypothetical protein
MTRRQYLRMAASVVWASRQALGNRKEEFVVIVHPSNRFDALSRSKVSYAFLRKVSRWPWGEDITPADLAANDPIRQKFVQEVLRISKEQLAEYWMYQRSTHGVSAPPQVRDASAAKLWVAARPGGIAYIPSSVLDATVKAIRVDP